MVDSLAPSVIVRIGRATAPWFPGTEMSIPQIHRPKFPVIGREKGCPLVESFIPGDSFS